ncbi:hypothetical protein BDN70DRAFT_923057 [Pholiota conissans]|uniref:Transmembrane protein n=1 Tax=Pholiota conissans TaxID=109636 RepID=A0A9P5YZM2_9AGAR|nr:hypothetical protein BDN70DRAFT_923057 [Pholiota conissans]
MLLHTVIHLLILIFAFLNHAVYAQNNITIDDTNAAISYAPAGAWVVSTNSTLDFGGAHMLTQNPNATAVFNFTGIAIYFLSPKWPYTVNTQLSLDGAAPVLVDLIDHTRPDVLEGPETVQSAVVWSATGLNDTVHTLVVSVGSGQPFGIVDGIIYTTTSSSPPSIPLTTISSSSSTSTFTSASTTPSSPSTTNAQPASSDSPSSQTATSASQKIRPLPIVLGSLFGLIGIGVVLLALVFACRRRRRPKSEAWTIDGTLYSSPSSRGAGGASNGSFRKVVNTSGGNDKHNRNHSYTSMPMSSAGSSHWDPGSRPNSPGGYPLNQTTQGAWHNTRFAYVGNTPPPPIPPSMPPASLPLSHQQQDAAARAPNRYTPGVTLSTITENSTPRAEAHASLANSPASMQEGELPPSSEVAGAGAGMAGLGAVGARRAYFGVQGSTTTAVAGQPRLPDYSAQAPQRQGQGQGQGRAGWI